MLSSDSRSVLVGCVSLNCPGPKPNVERNLAQKTHSVWLIVNNSEPFNHLCTFGSGEESTGWKHVLSPGKLGECYLNDLPLDCPRLFVLQPDWRAGSGATLDNQGDLVGDFGARGLVIASSMRCKSLATAKACASYDNGGSASYPKSVMMNGR